MVIALDHLHEVGWGDQPVEGSAERRSAELAGGTPHQEVGPGYVGEVFGPEFETLVNIALVPAGADLFLTSLRHKNDCR
ncbi:hypothetical protein D3C81_2187600 [compost metagenome]